MSALQVHRPVRGNDGEWGNPRRVEPQHPNALSVQARKALRGQSRFQRIRSPRRGSRHYLQRHDQRSLQERLRLPRLEPIQELTEARFRASGFDLQRAYQRPLQGQAVEGRAEGAQGVWGIRLRTECDYLHHRHEVLLPVRLFRARVGDFVGDEEFRVHV